MIFTQLEIVWFLNLCLHVDFWKGIRILGTFFPQNMDQIRVHFTLKYHICHDKANMNVPQFCLILFAELSYSFYFRQTPHPPTFHNHKQVTTLDMETKYMFKIQLFRIFKLLIFWVSECSGQYSVYNIIQLLKDLLSSGLGPQNRAML